MAPKDRIRIGRVGAVNPTKRELRITPKPAHRNQFNQLKWLRVATLDGDELRCRVANVRQAGDAVFVALSPGVPREKVGAMKGAEIVAAPDELQPPKPGEVDVEALIGFTVVAQDGAELGVVCDAMSAGGNDVLEVETSAGARFMFPAVAEAIREIDLDASRIIAGDLTAFRVDHAD